MSSVAPAYPPASSSFAAPSSSSARPSWSAAAPWRRSSPGPLRCSSLRWNAATESRRLADVSLATGRVRRGYARAPGELIRCCRERLERQDNAQRSRVDNVPRDGKAGLRNDLAHLVVISEHVGLEGRNASGAGDGA